MKKYYTIAVLLALAFAAQAQIADFPYNQGFESGLDGWTTIDADDDGDNWFVANDGEGGPGNHGNWYLSHSGQKVAISRGYAYGGNAYDPDNYLVSPEIEVNDDLVLEFWYAFSNPDQGSDPMLSVYVSTTGDTEADFQAGDSLTTYIAVDDDVWHLASLSLADYAGQTIRIALRHHHSYYQYHFMVDDIVIRSVNVPHVELLAPTLTGLDSTVLFTATLTEGSTTGLTWQWHSTMAYNDMAYMDQFADTAATILYYGVGYDTVSVTATNSYGSHTATAVVRVFDLEPATMPYTTGFEASEDVSFITFNGDNGWTVGNSAAATGQRSLYITYDGANGQNIYNATATSPNTPHSHSYAIRALDFSTAGLYYITYDWRCKGENNYDYMRVALAPQSQTFSDTTTLGITPSALPQGWISLDDSAALSGQNTWQAATHTFSVDTAGVYWLVVYWTNDENNGSNPAGAIDNIVVDNLNCPMPKDLVLDAATDSSLAFSWTPIGDESQWGIRLDGGQWTLVDSIHHTATGLAAAMTHSVEVRAMCDDGDSSFILASDFRTLCGVAQPTWQEVFADASAAECWTFVDGDSIEPSSAQAATTWYIGANRLRAPGHVATSDDWAIAPAIALPAGATGLVLAFDASAGQNASASHPSYYEVRANAAGTTDTALFTSLLLAEPLVGTAHRTVSLDAFAGDTLRLAFVHRAEMDGGMSIDNMVVRQTLAPVAAIDGHAIGNVGFTSTFEAVLVEGVAENLYYQWSSALSTTVEADSNTFSVTYFDAGVDTVSVTVSNDHGSTTVVLLVDVRDLGAAPLPYYTGFEEGDDTDWLTAGSGDNSWAIGTATAAQGTHSLYISNDGGQSNTYTFTSASNSIAYRALNVDQPGDHYLQYSWHCQGEGLITQYYDYMRVLLAPAHVDLTDHDLLQSLATSYQLPDGFINIACPVFMNGDTTSSHVVTIDQPGLYQLAFFWHNDQTVGANPPAAVDSISFGHVECALPQDLVLADATTTSLTVSWTAGGDDALWLVTVDDSLQTVVYDPEYHIDSLEPSTDHTVAVQTLCGASDTSLAVAATFRTLCAPVATLPFSEDFTSYTPAAMEPADIHCWQYFGPGAMTVVYRQFNNRLMMFQNLHYQSQLVVLPEFERPLNELQITLDALPEADASGWLQIGYLTDPADTATFVAIDTLMHHEFYNDDNSSLVFKNRKAIFESAPADARIALRHVVANYNYYWYIDNIVVDTIQPDPCLEPAITDTATTENTITVEWDGDAAQYEVAIVPGTWQEPVSADALLSATTYTFANLDTATAYTVGLRADCGDGRYSQWITMAIATRAAHVDTTHTDTTHTDTTGIAPTLGIPTLVLRPNPATTSVTIDAEAGATATLLDLAGRPVLHFTLPAASTTLDLHTLPQGSYFVRVTTAHGTAVRRLIVR